MEIPTVKYPRQSWARVFPRCKLRAHSELAAVCASPVHRNPAGSSTLLRGAGRVGVFSSMCVNFPKILGLLPEVLCPEAGGTARGASRRISAS